MILNHAVHVLNNYGCGQPFVTFSKPRRSTARHRQSRQTAMAEPVTRKCKRASKWLPEWKRYNMSESRKGPSFAIVRCNICDSDFSVASGGFHYVKHHLEGKKHNELARTLVSQPTCYKNEALIDSRMLRSAKTATKRLLNKELHIS